MAQYCKGVCVRFKAKKPEGVGSRRYTEGQKRCTICGIFLVYEGIWCPCCGYKLRITPRKSENKKTLREYTQRVSTA